MAVTKNELLDMLGKSISADLAAEGTPTPQKEPVFSKDFEQSMNEFFAKGSSAKKKNKVRPKRWLIIAIAAVVVLAATACAVPEIRESIAGFFVKVFGDHVEYTDPNVTKDSIEEEYGISPIPEGFIVESIVNGETTRITTYRNYSDDVIVLIQSVDPTQINSVDNEYGTSEEKVIDGKSVRIYTSDYFAQASWVQEGYYFSLTYNAPISSESFEDLICLVKNE